MTTLPLNHIESTINSLHIQNRTMIRLLLLQYFDLPQDEIEYMAIDQPDSRFMAGEQPEHKRFSREAIANVASRAGQYRLLLRQKRERPGFQIDCLKRMLAQTDAAITIVERLLEAECGVDAAGRTAANTQARTALVKQVKRQLLRAYDEEELDDETYRRQRLLLEYQLLIRRRERQRRRLSVAQQDFRVAGGAPLQDHEIAHIWGLPLGSLAARKVKALHQYVTSLQDSETSSQTTDEPEPASRPDYWQQTFHTLSKQPLSRSVVAYSGQERTEEQLMEKLQAFATHAMSEEEEAKFWMAITKIHDSEHAGMWISHERAIFSLQRLSAILQDMDTSDEAIQEEMLERIAPPTPQEQLPETEQDEAPAELSEEALGVLQKLVGELDDKRRN